MDNAGESSARVGRPRGVGPVFTPSFLARNIRRVLAYLYRVVVLLVAVPSGLLVAVGAARQVGHFEILNFPFPLRNWPLYLLVFAVSFALWIFSLRRAHWSEGLQFRQWPWCLKERHVVTVLVLFKVLIAIWICHRGFLFLSSDDFCRIDVAYRWRERPFFATWDHVWLAGQFYVQGSFIRLLGDPLVSARLSSLLFSVFYSLIFYRLAREVFDRRTAYLSFALLAVLPYPTWLSVSGHPNPFFMTFSLLGVLFLVTSRGRWVHLLVSAVAFGAASSFRYEGLLLGGVYVVWNIGLVLFDRRRWTAKALTAHVVLCLIPFGYIAAWSVSCYQTFGDAFKFLRTVQGFAPGPLTELGIPGRIMWYPKVLRGGSFDPGVENQLSPAIFFLGLAGMVVTLAFSRGKRKSIARYAFVVVLNFGFLIWTAIRGTGNVMAQRVVLLSQVAFIPFVVALFFAAWDSCRWQPRRRHHRGIALGLRAGLAAVLALIVAVELGKTLDFPSRIRGVYPQALALAEVLHQRFLDRKPPPEEVTAVLVDGQAASGTYWVFGVIGRRFERTLFLNRHWEQRIRAKLAERGLFLYVSFRQAAPEGLKAKRLDRRGKFQLWQVVNPDPETALALLRGRFPAD